MVISRTFSLIPRLEVRLEVVSLVISDFPPMYNIILEEIGICDNNIVSQNWTFIRNWKINTSLESTGQRKNHFTWKGLLIKNRWIS